MAAAAGARTKRDNARQRQVSAEHLGRHGPRVMMRCLGLHVYAQDPLCAEDGASVPLPGAVNSGNRNGVRTDLLVPWYHVSARRCPKSRAHGLRRVVYVSSRGKLSKNVDQSLLCGPRVVVKTT